MDKSDTMERTDVERQVEALKRALTEKDVLLGEIHHRVKNNMQMVIGLLRLQARRMTDPALRQQFDGAAQRVQALALVQNELQRGGSDLSHIDMVQYLSSLTQAMMDLYAPPGVEAALPDGTMRVALKQASPIGMAVNELLSNSLKFAFPEGRQGKINVDVESAGDGRVRVTVADDGVGFEESVYEAADSLGFTLVKNLAVQASAEVDVDLARGARFTFVFPVEQPG
jgi:two-component sensor histidine kinase